MLSRDFLSNPECDFFTWTGMECRLKQSAGRNIEFIYDKVEDGSTAGYVTGWRDCETPA